MAGFYNLTNVLIKDENGLVKWEKIVRCSPKTHIWNGYMWAPHKGIMPQGKGYLCGLGGLYATPDVVFALSSTSLPMANMHDDKNLISSALMKASDHEPPEGFPKPEYRAPMGNEWTSTFILDAEWIMVRGNVGPFMVRA